MFLNALKPCACLNGSDYSVRNPWDSVFCELLAKSALHPVVFLFFFRVTAFVSVPLSSLSSFLQMFKCSHGCMDKRLNSFPSSIVSSHPVSLMLTPTSSVSPLYFPSSCSLSLPFPAFVKPALNDSVEVVLKPTFYRKDIFEMFCFSREVWLDRPGTVMESVRKPSFFPHEAHSSSLAALRLCSFL